MTLFWPNPGRAKISPPSCRKREANYLILASIRIETANLQAVTRFYKNDNNMAIIQSTNGCHF